MSLLERLAARSLPNLQTGCIEWTGPKLKAGYGVVYSGKERELAHRLAWQKQHGPIPEGMYVCHKCDNPMCVRIEHLFLGTPSENLLDCHAKGRKPRFLKKLTLERLRAAREFIAAGWTNASIASAFGVDPSSISRIRTGARGAYEGFR